MSEDDWLFRLEDMFERAIRVQNYTATMTEEQFFSDQLVIDAVAHNLMIIGEAAKKCRPIFAMRHPQSLGPPSAG